MKIPAFLALAALVALSGCRKKAPEEATVTEIRPLTTSDKAPKLFATSDERFRDARPSPVQAETPAGWLKLPATQMRLLNYRVGETGMTEVWVSISSGSVLDNVNRWLDQFGAAKLDDAQLASQRRVPIADIEGVWVEAAGEYGGGMGAPPKSDYALAGVIGQRKGSILTVKMVGPKAEVAAAKAAVEAFSKALRVVE